MTPFNELEDYYGYNLIENIEDLDRDLDPDYDPFPLDNIPTDAIYESYLRENPPMAKGRNKGRSGKKQRQKQNVVTSTVQGATPGSANAGKAVTPKKKTYNYDVWDDSEDWWDTGGLGYSEYGTTKKTAATTATPGGFGTKCRHYNTVDSGGVNIKGLTFYPSSMNNQRKDDDLIPDWGLYLDWGWKHPDWRAENIDWRDFGLPSNYVVAFEAMVEVIERSQRGEKVEIGCIGGHGRTGTALACIAVILGMTPDEAIKHVRTQYCSHTIETDEQEWFVEWVDAQMRGVKAPPQPERQVTTYTSPVVVRPCNQFDHFYMWLRGLQVCSKRQSACTFYNTAIAGFEKLVPAYLLAGNDIEWHRKEAKAYRLHPHNPNKPKPNSGGAVIPKKPTGKAFQAHSSPAKSTTVSQLPPKPKKRKDIIVEDYLVPEPTGFDVEHAPNKRTGCVCDVCRYINSGHEAFLEPYDLQLGAERQKQLDALEEKAESTIRLRIIREAAATPPTSDDRNKVWIVTGDKGLVEIVVDSKFDKPPSTPGIVTGELRGKYTWVGGSNVWAYKPSKG